MLTQQLTQQEAGNVDKNQTAVSAHPSDALCSMRAMALY